MTKVERRAIRLASAALSAAVHGDQRLAAKAVQRISDECGSEGLSRAILGWSDTLLGRMGHVPGRPVHLAFQNADSGRIDPGDSEAVPETVRWAGDLLAARAADDEQAWTKLMDSLPDDGQAIGDHVFALLQMVALMLARAGWGR